MCGPKENGQRKVGATTCGQKCKHYKDCLKELGIERQNFEFKQFKATARDVELGLCFMNYRGEPKVWRLVPIKNKKKKKNGKN